MPTISATAARKDFYKLIDRAAMEHEPITITGKRNNAVLINEGDWLAIQETIYLSSIPGMRDSITGGMQAADSEFSDKLDW